MDKDLLALPSLPIQTRCTNFVCEDDFGLDSHRDADSFTDWRINPQIFGIRSARGRFLVFLFVLILLIFHQCLSILLRLLHPEQLLQTSWIEKGELGIVGFGGGEGVDIQSWSVSLGR